jgi:hypothetical protein
MTYYKNTTKVLQLYYGQSTGRLRNVYRYLQVYMSTALLQALQIYYGQLQVYGLLRALPQIPDFADVPCQLAIRPVN